MWRVSMLFFLLFAFLAFMPKGKNGYSKRNYFFHLEVIILGKLKEIITINIGYRVLTGRRRDVKAFSDYSKAEQNQPPRRHGS
jgi:hypothetical protein